MSILHTSHRRYATKAFDPQRKLNAEQISTLKTVLRNSPSSINYQGWHFLILTSDEAKTKLAASCHGNLVYNAAKIKDASMVVVFCAKNEVSITHGNRTIEQEYKDGRFNSQETKTARESLIAGYLDALIENGEAASKAWLEKQVYIALGQVLLAAADMNIDSLALEGFDKELTNANFALNEKGLHACVVACFGYRSESDANADLPKSRLAEAEIFTEL